MVKFYRLNIFLLIVIFLFAELFCTGIGMGVPFFNILLGFAVGWFASKRALVLHTGNILKKASIYMGFSALITFIIMIVIWARWIPLIFNENTDFTATGIPLFLYDPKISFTGWIVLMIIASPLLKLMASFSAAYIVFSFSKKKLL